MYFANSSTCSSAYCLGQDNIRYSRVFELLKFLSCHSRRSPHAVCGCGAVGGRSMSRSLLSPVVAPRRRATLLDPQHTYRRRRSTWLSHKSNTLAASANDDENEDDGEEEGGGGETDDGKFTLRGRFNASPKSVYRALTEYEGLQNMSHSIVSCKRMWISSRVGRTVLRLESRDRNLLWGTMKGDIIVEVTEDVQRGTISFRADNVDDRAAFAVQGMWNIHPVKDATYLCDVRIELEVIPLRYAVTTSSLRRWTNAQLPAVVRRVVARSIELDQVRLRAPRFLPALERPFGSRSERDGGRSDTRAAVGGPLGYLGLSELPLPLRGDGGGGGGGYTISGGPDTGQFANSAADNGAGAGSESKGSRGQSTIKATGGGDLGEVTETSVSDGTQPAERWFMDDDDNLNRPGASEVHMRRFDTETTLHRRALGAVRIEAPPDVVYQILTNFEGMSNFVPNLAFTERVEVPFNMRNRPGRLRLRQVFLKCQLYHFLEAALTLDVVKKDDKGEVQFRVLDEGASGEILQGKWLVAPCPYDDEDGDVPKARLASTRLARAEVGVDAENSGNDADDAASVSGSISEPEPRSGSRSKATILKFAIEGRALRRRQSIRGFWLSSGPTAVAAARDSPLPERAVFEEILLMLHSAREHVEGTFEKEQRATLTLYTDSDNYYLSESILSADGVIDPVASLRSQMLALGFGADGLMPRRSELRALGAYDVEKAVVAGGGFEKVAERLGWTSNRKKPRGYWSDLTNVEREVLSFIEDNELESGVMPSRPQLEELGRKDIAKSLAKHGGAGVIAEKIGLVSRRYRPRKKATTREARNRID